ncbi:probable glutathione S-transferase [Tanacetum coccineum]
MRSTDENPLNVIVSDANPARGGRKHARMADLVFEKHDWMIPVLVPGDPEEDAFEQDPFEKFDKRRSVLVQGEPEEDSIDYDPFAKFDKTRSVLVQGEPEEDSIDYDPFAKFDKTRFTTRRKRRIEEANPFCSIYGRRRRGDLITMLPVVVVVVSPFPATHKIEMYSISRTNSERVKRFDTSLLLEDYTIPDYESGIIVQYIDDVWNDNAPLFPSDPCVKARAMFWADFIDKKLNQLGKSLYTTKGEEHEASRTEFIDGLKLLEG